MVPPDYEGRVYLPRIGGVMSSNDTRREAYMHGDKVLYRTVPAYRCEQLESVSYYDFGSVVFKVVQSRGAYRIVVDKDETNQQIQIWVEGLGFYEGRNLGGTFKQFSVPHKPKPQKPDQERPKPKIKPLKRAETKNYRENLLKSKTDGCPVTVIMPAVARVQTTKKTVTGIMRHANFPHLFKAIIHPDRVKLIDWLENLGVEVIRKHYFPIVKAKSEMVKLCKTKYLFMFDNDLLVKKPLKPILDFMETHPEVGVCATAIEGTLRHAMLHYGANISITPERVFLTESLEKKTPYRYCNYIHHGATLWRMKVFKDIKYDLNFKGQGHEHEDIFFQLAETKWKAVSYNDVTVQPILEHAPSWYSRLRREGINDSYAYFKSKWNIKRKEEHRR